MDVFFTTASVFSPSSELVLVINSAGWTAVGDYRRERWSELGVRVLHTENHHKVDPEIWKSWQNQFFIIDALRALSEEYSDGSSVVLLDSDCVIVDSLEGLDMHIQESLLVLYPTSYAMDDDVNGVRVSELQAMATRFALESRRNWTPRDVPYYGGEFLGVRGDCIVDAARLLEEAFEWMKNQAMSGNSFPREEAHLMSIALPMLQLSGGGEEYIRRLWTQPWRFRNVREDDRKLPIWHLPAEKRTGLRRLAKPSMLSRIRRQYGDNCSKRLRLARELGLTENNFWKWARDLAILAMAKCGLS